MTDITDIQLKLINKVKYLIQDIAENGVEYITYWQITKLSKALDNVQEESNLKHQKHTIDWGEDKGKVSKDFWSDFVRADHPNVYKEEDND
jgi:hypothetical protein